MVADEWDGWQMWDGTIEVLPSFQSRRQSTASSFYGSESSAMDMVKNPESIFCDGVADDDAPFELDEPSTSLPYPFLSVQHNDESRSIKLRDQSMENLGRPLHAYSTLTVTEERRLRDIAMPDHIMARITSTNEKDIEISTETKRKPRGTKRKSSTANEDPIDMCQYRKQSHNTIEKRYRINLNDKINMLRQRIPKFHDAPSRITEDDEGEEGATASAYKSGKAAVLTGAVEYITQLESSTKRLGQETAALRARLEAFEKLAISGSIFSGKDMSSVTCVSERLEGIQARQHRFCQY
jgi:Helix-loop-helix DNA-binding domain